MNYRLIAKYIGHIMFVEGILMLPALGIALYKGESAAAHSFFATALVLILTGLALSHIKQRNGSIFSREGFLIVALSWITMSVFGALPFYLSDSIPSLLDSIFEAVSGFTTTGASILTDVEALPMSMLYWRSFTHWVGGMGVLVFVLAIAPAAKETGGSIRILRAESPGPSVGKLVPKLRHTARILYLMYIFLTVIEIIFLLAGRMPVFDSITNAFGTAGTGGFAIKNASIAYYDSAYVDAVIGTFMFIFGVNFNIYYMLLVRDFRSVFKDTELRVYLGIAAISITLIAINTYSMFGSVGQTLRHSFFQVSSIMTTTGFATTNFDTWPQFSRVLLLLLMVVGSCAGSTAGGVKVARLVIFIKSLRNSVHKMLHPRSVKLLKMDGKTIDADTVAEVNAYLVIYVFILAASVLIVSIDNYSFDTSVSGVLACLNNIGPGLDVVGPVGNYSSFSFLSKLVLIADMLFGRLEIFPMLLMFAPSVWRRRSR